jgi:hypothetical protein
MKLHNYIELLQLINLKTTRRKIVVCNQFLQLKNVIYIYFSLVNDFFNLQELLAIDIFSSSILNYMLILLKIKNITLRTLEYVFEKM